MNIENLSLLCDFYELTMGNGYLNSKHHNDIAYFDVYFRKIPDDGGFAITAGLSHVIEYIKNLSFSKEDIEYLKAQNKFSDEFLAYLSDFKFSCDVFAVPEGTPVFSNEPVLTVRGNIIQAQMIETMVLLCINHQSLIATKANRIVRAAQGRPVMEFGARRAQGVQAAVLGARAAYIAGCVGTSCTLCAKKYNIPAMGTMAHSWVQMFDTEYEAFEHYAKLYPDECNLLVDTYNVLKSGMPNAIKVFNEVVVKAGFRPKGVRIDSGDIAYLSMAARKMLDAAGFEDCAIVASNSMDEIIIRDAILQGARIDSFGVGERLITSKSEPVFGGVYKLVGVERGGKIIPKIKVSENVAKITTPHFKKTLRIYSKETNKAMADLICLWDEKIDDTKPLEIFDPDYTWKRKTIENFYLKELAVPIFIGGKQVYKEPSVEEIREHCQKEINDLWDEVKRFENPHKYYVDLSQKLWDVKAKLLKESRGNI